VDEQTKDRAIIIEELNQNKNIVSDGIYDQGTEYHLGGLPVDKHHSRNFFSLAKDISKANINIKNTIQFTVNSKEKLKFFTFTGIKIENIANEWFR